MKNYQKIYIKLLEEGTPTLRPTLARFLYDGLFEVLPTQDYDPEDEMWEFKPGSYVSLVDIEDDGGEIVSLAVTPVK
jgi:hypothetical protein